MTDDTRWFLAIFFFVLWGPDALLYIIIFMVVTSGIDRKRS